MSADGRLLGECPVCQSVPLMSESQAQTAVRVLERQVDRLTRELLEAQVDKARISELEGIVEKQNRKLLHNPRGRHHE